MIRIDKYLADMGIGTRQSVKRLIRQGKVRVGETVIRVPDYKVEENREQVFFEDQLVTYAAYEYYMLNKPSGVVSATEDKKDPTVIELIGSKKRKDLFPVGRLDKDTEGLLLITNDGALAHRLLSPNRHVDKTYYARVKGLVTEQDVETFAGGVNIGTGQTKEWTRPGRLTILSAGRESSVRLTIQEGKYHQVKRMFEAVGKEVIYLKRESFGSLALDQDLGPGDYRELTKEEKKKL